MKRAALVGLVVALGCGGPEDVVRPLPPAMIAAPDCSLPGACGAPAQPSMCPPPANVPTVPTGRCLLGSKGTYCYWEMTPCPSTCEPGQACPLIPAAP